MLLQHGDHIARSTEHRDYCTGCFDLAERLHADMMALGVTLDPPSETRAGSEARCAEISAGTQRWSATLGSGHSRNPFFTHKASKPLALRIRAATAPRLPDRQ